MKTVQNIERELRIPVATSPDRPEFCLKSGQRQLSSLPQYPSGPEDPIFNVQREGQWQPLTKGDLEKFLKSHLRALRIKGRMITASSFRKGGLSHMLLKTGYMMLLRLQGDWSSECYKRYIVIPAEMRFEVTKFLYVSMP